MTEPSNAARLEQLLEMTDDQLLAEIGADLLPRGLGFGSGSGEFARNAAARWVAARRDELRDLICSDPVVVKLLGEEDGRTTTLGVASALSRLMTINYGLSTGGAFALLIFLTRMGLPRFCGLVTADEAPAD